MKWALPISQASSVDYSSDRDAIVQYLTNWLNYCAQAEREQDENPPAIVSKLKQRKAQQILETPV